MALTKATYSMISGAPVNVLDYGADPTGTADSTIAFNNAVAVSKNLYAPNGTYKLTNWSPPNGTVLKGAGYTNTFLNQGAANQPCILISNGNNNWQSLEFSGFTINGATSPTVAAFQISLGTSGALWRSKFDFVCENTYQALNISITGGGTNFFDNDIYINSEGTLTTAVYIQSGTYNRYVLFLTNCSNSKALDHGGIGDTIQCTSDGQILSSGLGTVFINPTVENLYGSSLSAGSSCIQMTGTSETLINPSIILPAGSASKTTYAIQPSTGSIVENPYITSNGTILANPFALNYTNSTWTLVNGSSNCSNTMETIYNESSNATSLRYVTMIGDVSQLSTQSQTHGGKVIQYSAPTTSFSLDIKGNADCVILEPSGTIATAQFNLIYGLVNGRVTTITTTQTLTAVSFVSSANTSLLPTTLTANNRISFIYNATQNKFYLV